MSSFRKKTNKDLWKLNPEWEQYASFLDTDTILMSVEMLEDLVHDTYDEDKFFSKEKASKNGFNSSHVDK